MVAQSQSPLLASYSVKRAGNDEIPGHYCRKRDVWVVDLDGKTIPIVSQASSLLSDIPITKAKGERDQIGMAALLESTTKTMGQIERDDTVPSPNYAWLLELATKTESKQERDDR